MVRRLRARVVPMAVAAAAMVVLGLPRPVRGAVLDLRMTSAGAGRLVAAKTIALEPGEEVRFVRTGVRLPGHEGPVDLVLAVSLESETASSVVVSLNGLVRVPGAATPLAWTARSYTLARGEAAAFTVEAARGAAPVEFAARLGGEATPAAPDLLAGVRLTTLVRVTELRDGAPRVLEERRVRLVGPDATEVVLGAGLASDVSSAALVLRLVPRSRDHEGVVLDLSLEARGRARVIREERLALGFDDRVEVQALEGRNGPVIVEIRPER